MDPIGLLILCPIILPFQRWTGPGVSGGHFPLLLQFYLFYFWIFYLWNHAFVRCNIILCFCGFNRWVSITKPLFEKENNISCLAWAGRHTIILQWITEQKSDQGPFHILDLCCRYPEISRHMLRRSHRGL